MTNEIEKTFFDTFGIPRLCTSQVCKHWGSCEGCSRYPDFALDYPQITDRILLHLLCILNNYGDIISSNNIKKLQDEILIKIITLSKDIDITPQVRALFSNK